MVHPSTGVGEPISLSIQHLSRSLVTFAAFGVGDVRLIHAVTWTMFSRDAAAGHSERAVSSVDVDADSRCCTRPDDNHRPLLSF